MKSTFRFGLNGLTIHEQLTPYRLRKRAHCEGEYPGNATFC